MRERGIGKRREKANGKENRGECGRKGKGEGREENVKRGEWNEGVREREKWVREKG